MGFLELFNEMMNNLLLIILAVPNFMNNSGSLLSLECLHCYFIEESFLNSIGHL